MEHAYAAVGEFEVLGIEAERFVDPQAGAVEQGNQGPVPLSGRSVAATGPHEGADLGVGENLRRPTPPRLRSFRQVSPPSIFELRFSHKA